MQPRPSYTHIFYLTRELRQAAIDNQSAAMERDAGGYGLCLGAALANDAADALEALLAERPANDQRAARIYRRK